jgi:hypothetical protein
MPHKLLAREAIMPTEEQIKQLAHTLWEQEGRPEGRDLDHYLTAKQILEEQEGAKKPARARRPAATKPAKARRRSPRAKKG